MKGTGYLNQRHFSHFDDFFLSFELKQLGRPLSTVPYFRSSPFFILSEIISIANSWETVVFSSVIFPFSITPIVVFRLFSRFFEIGISRRAFFSKKTGFLGASFSRRSFGGAGICWRVSATDYDQHPNSEVILICFSAPTLRSFFGCHFSQFPLFHLHRHKYLPFQTANPRKWARMETIAKIRAIRGSLAAW